MTTSTAKKNTAKNILIIGAGAVGTVYGYYLQTAGHTVSFLVKPKHVADLDGGYYINQLQKKTAPIHFRDYTLETQDSLDANKPWDVVIITLSTTALPKLSLSNINTSGADVVLLSPGLEDLAVVKAKLAHQSFASLTTGMINLISFINTDIDTSANSNTDTNSSSQSKAHITLKQPVQLGDSLVTCVYFPPTPMPFSDGKQVNTKTAAAKRVASLFDDAGISAKAVKSSLKMAIYPNIFLTMFVLALEAAGWSFAKLATSSALLKDMLASINTLSKVSKTHYELGMPLHLIAMQPWLVKLGLRLAPSLFSFDIEQYLAYHFTKVGEQSYEHTQSYIDIAQAQGVPTQAVARLLNAARSAS